jgi:hypothetical protein
LNGLHIAGIIFNLISQNELATNPDLHGSMMISIVAGTDKTTVSVATGDNSFYPLYMSIGNLHNNARQAHRHGVVLVGFLAIPKGNVLLNFCIIYTYLGVGDRDDDDGKPYKRWCRQLFHGSLSAIFGSLRPFMTKPDIVRCPDGHWRRAVYQLGPYIADYPEQVLCSCILYLRCTK